ncbi:MAG: DNA-binding response regulator [Bacteroidetes bacterium 46-16]|nr:MAG: DNA-binding response regulator [Bacteroidetes bacterium 46-16]
MSIKVVVIEDQKETRDMLAILINSSGEYECTGTFANSEDALEHIPRLLPDVALVDINLPGISGTECVARLRGLCPSVQYIMCTSLEDSDTIFAALQAGASGYITKSAPPAKMLEAINDVHNGGSPMSSQIARKVVAFFQQKEQVKNNAELQKLSPREQEILDFLSKGFRYKEIAATLFLSIETVRKHIHNIYEKLQVDSRTDALNKIYTRR